MASSVLIATTFSNSLGETSITRLTLHSLKNAMRSSSTAEVIRVLPSRLEGRPTALISAKVPTITCDLATTLDTREFLNWVSDDSSISAPRPLSTHSLPRAYTSNCSSEVSMVGAPVWNSASAKLRFLV